MLRIERALAGFRSNSTTCRSPSTEYFLRRLLDGVRLLGAAGHSVRVLTGSVSECSWTEVCRLTSAGMRACSTSSEKSKRIGAALSATSCGRHANQRSRLDVRIALAFDSLR